MFTKLVEIYSRMNNEIKASVNKNLMIFLVKCGKTAIQILKVREIIKLLFMFFINDFQIHGVDIIL